MIIKKFSGEEVIQQELENIFWLTASAPKSESLFYRYMGIYLERNKPIFYAYDEENNRVLGYILGDTDWDDEYTKLFAFYSEAMPSLKSFPAHLHINCHPDAQGRGVGSSLLAFYEAFLREQHISGLHLVTSLNAENVKFYKKNLYLSLYQTCWKGADLVFLGKTLEA